MTPPYLFTSKRLGFRSWAQEDLPLLHQINTDPGVMRYFPRILTRSESTAFIDRMNRMFFTSGHCYFAVELTEKGAFIGFIGLDIKTFEVDFSPVQDIGWRLARQYWGYGYATEGAERCLEFAKSTLGWKEVFAIAPQVNTPSISVMKKVGMHRVKTFVHPQLAADSALQPCVLYRKAL